MDPGIETSDKSDGVVLEWRSSVERVSVLDLSDPKIMGPSPAIDQPYWYTTS